MTDEELRAARLIEAKRRWIENETPRREVEHLADLYESNWTPPEPVVDPDLVTAREWHASCSPNTPEWQVSALSGRLDKSTAIQSFIAGIKHSKADSLLRKFSWEKDQ